MGLVRLVVLVLAISLVWTSAASAMNCQNWNRLAAGQKPTEVDSMIRSAVAGQRGRSYEVNRGAIERCLLGQARNIEYEFDDACGNSRTASMQAINTIFKNYIWACVN